MVRSTDSGQRIDRKWSRSVDTARWVPSRNRKSYENNTRSVEGLLERHQLPRSRMQSGQFDYRRHGLYERHCVQRRILDRCWHCIDARWRHSCIDHRRQYHRIRLDHIVSIRQSIAQIECDRQNVDECTRTIGGTVYGRSWWVSPNVRHSSRVQFDIAAAETCGVCSCHMQCMRNTRIRAHRIGCLLSCDCINVPLRRRRRFCHVRGKCHFIIVCSWHNAKRNAVKLMFVYLFLFREIFYSSRTIGRWTLMTQITVHWHITSKRCVPFIQLSSGVSLCMAKWRDPGHQWWHKFRWDWSLQQYYLIYLIRQNSKNYNNYNGETICVLFRWTGKNVNYYSLCGRRRRSNWQQITIWKWREKIEIIYGSWKWFLFRPMTFRVTPMTLSPSFLPSSLRFAHSARNDLCDRWVSTPRPNATKFTF